MIYAIVKRCCDVFLSLALLLVCAVPMLAIAALIKITSRGPVIFWSDRIGRHNRVFRMAKFRTMRADTPQLATHLMTQPQLYLTPIGGFLRTSSLDELPQLFNVLKGDMSFVGPRPALFNQDDLVALRTAAGVHRLIPGVTGWAQINGRDDLPIPVKVQFDSYYLQHRCLLLDLRILFLTVFKVARAEGVKH